MSKLLDELSREYFEWVQEKEERLIKAQHEYPGAIHHDVGPTTLEAFLFDRAYKKALENLETNTIVLESTEEELGL